MKNLKYLNGVLTVIAVCLVLLTLSVIGVIPKAAASTSTKFATVPVNPDGSINVHLVEPQEGMKVDITKISGHPIKMPSGLTFDTPWPIPVKETP